MKLCILLCTNPLSNSNQTSQIESNAIRNETYPQPSIQTKRTNQTNKKKTQDYNKTVYSGSGSQQSKGQNISNPPPSGTGSDISSSMYGNKSHAALNKVNVSYPSLAPNNLLHLIIPSIRWNSIVLFFFFLNWNACRHTPTVVRETIVPFGNTTAIQSGWYTNSWCYIASIRSTIIHSSYAGYTQHEHASTNASGKLNIETNSMQISLTYATT